VAAGGVWPGGEDQREIRDWGSVGATQRAVQELARRRPGPRRRTVRCMFVSEMSEMSENGVGPGFWTCLFSGLAPVAATAHPRVAAAHHS
jgi:hypothetical protein